MKIDNEEEITKKYDYIEQIVNECLENKKEREQSTDKIDKILTILLIPFLLLNMSLMNIFLANLLL